MRSITFFSLAAGLLVIACDSGTPSNGSQSGASGTATGGSQHSSTSATSGGDGGHAGGCTAIDGEVTNLVTDDGVTLEADLYTTGNKGGPGVVLLHMIPPSNDRSNYSAAFISKLTAAGLNVLNVDRRGAGKSAGVAKEAYQGPNGKLDAKAAVAFLTGHACAIDPARIALVGASNGTTTALDYAVFAAADASAPAPALLVFLTGGSYTENQNQLNDAGLANTPLLFVYSNTEKQWSGGFKAGASASWKFSEYNPGAHGTNMFNTRPEAMDEVTTFIAGKL